MRWNFRRSQSPSDNPFPPVSEHPLPELPNMTVHEFLERVKSAAFAYNMACAQLKKTNDQSPAQIQGARTRKAEAEEKLRKAAREFIGD